MIYLTACATSKDGKTNQEKTSTANNSKSKAEKPSEKNVDSPGTSTNDPILQKLSDEGFSIAKEKVEAPNFKAKLLNGKMVSLKDYRGKIVFLNFWATWCGPCVREMPSMQVLYEKMKDQPFVILALSNEDHKTVKSFIDKNKYDFPILLGDATENYGITGIPSTFIIGKDGNLLGRLVGGNNWSTKAKIKLFKEIAKK